MYDLNCKKPRLLALCTSFLTVVACGPKDSVSQTKVVGGRVVAEESPADKSTVAIVDKNESPEERTFCSGTLVAPNLVVTAAHCLMGLAPKDIQVAFGTQANATAKLAADVELIDVVDSKMYKEDYEVQYGINFDLAWVKLAHDAPKSAKPIEIWRDGAALSSADPLLLAGFGLNAEPCEDGTNCLGTKFETPSRFRDYLNEGFLFHIMRVGPTPGSGACSGDSGGPAYVQKNGSWYLAGATHGNQIFLTPEAFPGGEVTCKNGSDIYTFVGDYAQWISQTSGVDLLHDPLKNPEGVRRILTSKGVEPSSLEEWLAFDDHESPAWLSIAAIVQKSIFNYAVANFGEDDEAPDLAHIYRDPKRLLEEAEKLASFGDGDVESSFNQYIADLRPIALLPALKSLVLDKSRLSDFSLLAKMTKLESLVVQEPYSLDDGAPVALDLAFARELTNLRNLRLAKAQVKFESVKTSSILAHLESLELVEVNGSQDDFARLPWESAIKLESVNLSENGLTDLDFLSSAPKLRRLEAKSNNLTSVTSVAAMTDLLELAVDFNKIDDFTPLAEHPSLIKIDGSYNAENAKTACPSQAECRF